MARRLVYLMTPAPRSKKSYQIQIEYMPGYVKTFVGTKRSWLHNEVEEALDTQVPTLSGPITLEEENE